MIGMDINESGIATMTKPKYKTIIKKQVQRLHI